jgi:hypothetical protein
MSTRAHIIIKEWDNQIHLYHHCDGYPEGIGIDLKNIIHKLAEDPEYRTRDLIQGKLIPGDDSYAPALCLHGDEEYVYVIDCVEKSIKCYQHEWDVSLEDTIRPENEIEIN